MAEPITIVSTTLAATSHAFKLGQQCYELINGIKGAPDNINRLATDLKGLYNILGTLQAVLESEDVKKRQSVIPNHMVSNVKELVDNCMKLFVDVNMVVKPYTGADGRALRSNWKGFRWEFKKGSVEALQRTLSQYKLTLDLACSSLSFLNSSQTVEMVQRIEKDIRKLQNQIDNREREEVYQHYQEHPMLDGSYEGFSDASYNIPMRRFLERTETIISSSSRSSRYPSMLLSDSASDHTILPGDSASIMDTGTLNQESEDIQDGAVRAENLAEESNTTALVSSLQHIEPEDSLFIDRSKSVENADEDGDKHLTTTIREGPEPRLNYHGLGYFDISGGDDTNGLNAKTGHAETELLSGGYFSTDKGSGPTNSVYFGPYLKYINMDLERGIWLGSIMLITYAPQPPTIHIHQSVDFSPNPRQLKANPIYTHQKWVFYCYYVDLQMGERGSAKWIYAITSHIGCTRYEFLVAGRYETNWRFIAHSGNDFSMATNHYERQQLGGVGLMWKDVMQKNVDCGGFHVQLGLGGQIYGDRVWKEVPLLKQWLAIQGRDNRKYAEWTAKHEEDISQAFFHYYTMDFDQPYLREAFAQIPHILQIDDHDIFDGFGSYPSYMQSSDIFKNIGRIGVKMYLLFQHHTNIELLQNVSNDVDLFTITGAGWHFVKYLGPAVVVVGPDVRSERTQQQVMAGQTYQGLFPKVATLPPSVQHCIWMIAVPVIYPRLETSNNVGKVSSWVVGQKKLAQFGFSQAKNAAGKSGLKGGNSNFSGDNDIADELKDMWTHESKDLERTYLIRTLQGIAYQKGIRMTFVSGQVRCCGAGLVHDPSHPSDHKTMYQIISSSIVAAPISNYHLNMLHNHKVLYVPMNGQRSTHAASDTKEDMMEIFQTDPNGAARELKKLMSRRNYVAFVAYDPEEIPGMSNEIGNYTSQHSLGQRLSKLNLVVDFIVQGDGAMSASTRYGPVIIPHLEFGR